MKLPKEHLKRPKGHLKHPKEHLKRLKEHLKRLKDNLKVPKKENLKEFMAQRHAPSYNPFQKKESEVRPGKKGSKPVNPLAKKIERRGRKLKRKAGKKKKKPTDWTLHGKWNDPKIP